jgi:hypothetical protein
MGRRRACGRHKITLARQCGLVSGAKSATRELITIAVNVAELMIVPIPIRRRSRTSAVLHQRAISVGQTISVGRAIAVGHAISAGEHIGDKVLSTLRLVVHRSILLSNHTTHLNCRFRNDRSCRENRRRLLRRRWGRSRWRSVNRNITQSN